MGEAKSKDDIGLDLDGALCAISFPGISEHNFRSSAPPYFAHVISRSSCAWIKFGCVGMTRTFSP